ncbi:GIN domain-containing protein [Sphingomonas sp.]|uniref:GIN domain-containing protein n=1 Tax=Sphingomonas sp. TaxID=28214 RepID=UPI0035BBDAEB
MIRLATAALLLCTAAAASAADRPVGIGTFDRVRIDGAFDVRIATGRSPRATLSGDARALDMVDLRVEGTTLYLRRRSNDAAVRAVSPVVVVTLSTQTLASVAMLGSGKLTVAGMHTERANLSVAGTGEIAVEGMDAQQTDALVVGGGSIALAGRAIKARLSTNGPGEIDAAGLATDDLTVRVDGPGETRAQARYQAAISMTGLGRVVVTGNATCTIRAPAGGDVVCGNP